MSPLTERLAEVIAPLEDDEARRAIEAAVAYVGGSVRVHDVELRVDKLLRRNPLRQVTVWLVDERAVVHEVVVDADGNVVDDRVRGDLVLPFLPGELDRAVAVAAAHPEISRLTDDPTVARAVFYPGHAMSGDQHSGRRVGFHYFDASDPDALTPLASVVVDVVAGEIESYRDDRPGQ